MQPLFVAKSVNDLNKQKKNQANKQKPLWRNGGKEAVGTTSAVEGLSGADCMVLRRNRSGVIGTWWEPHVQQDLAFGENT